MHDYDPSWDYPVMELAQLTDLSTSEREDVERAVNRVRSELAPSLDFVGERAFEVFYTEPFGLLTNAQESVAVFCSGTSSRPVIGLDLVHMKQICDECSLDFYGQVCISLAHELAHAYQEAAGVAHEDEAFDEDAAETFARDWADLGKVQLDLLDPTEQVPPKRPCGP